MDFEYLDAKSEKLLKELLKKDNILNMNIQGETIEYLVKKGYINGTKYANLNGKDEKNNYNLKSITYEGKIYFEMKKKYEKEKKKITRREVISAIIGACIGLIPWLISII